MPRSGPIETSHSIDRVDRRTLVKVAAAGAIAGTLAASLPADSPAAVAAFVPNNFRAVVHVTNEDGMQYAFAALETITENYDKATARLVIDGSAVKLLTTDDGMNSIKAAHEAGSEIAVASDALAINGIDPTTLPDFIDQSNPGIIAVVDSQVKGFHYYKV